MSFTRYNTEDTLSRLVDIMDHLEEILGNTDSDEEKSQPDLFLVNDALDDISPKIKSIKKILIK